MSAYRLSNLWMDSERARIEWLQFYRTLPKHGRNPKDGYKENGLWRRWKNRERKYEAAYAAARTDVPALALARRHAEGVES